MDECGNTPNPTLGMKIGETYTFVQNDRSNYYHPIGFAYFPDGAHDNVEELEPGIGFGTNGCNATEETLACPAPMYFVGGEYVGEYSNIPEIKNITASDNFGLDDYEPLFFLPLPEWDSKGGFEVKLRFDDETFAKDIFYFCHVSAS